MNISVKTAQPVPERIALIADKQANSRKSLSQTGSANDLGMAVIGLIMSNLGIALVGIKKHE